jgi:hypothetical protein
MYGIGLRPNMWCMSRIINTLKKLAGPTQPFAAGANVTVRHASPDDAHALAVLAQLNTSHAPRGDVIVGESGGELWAAVSVDDGHAIANPFRPSGELTFHLIERARELRRAARSKPRPAPRLISA